MRLLHTSDWHLGQSLATFSRHTEHDQFLNWLLDTITARAIDIILITGDVYDSMSPSVASQELFYSFLKRLPPRVSVIVTAGNHDSPSRLCLPAPLVNNAEFVGALTKSADGVIDLGHLIRYFKKDGVELAVIAMPYVRPGDLPAEGAVEALKALWANTVTAAHAAYPNARLIGTAHLSVLGGEPSVDSERAIVIGGLESVPLSLFPASLEYLALGHHHKPQAVNGHIQARYAGSPLPMSAAEVNYRHSVVICEFAPQGPVTQEIVEIPRPAPFIRFPDNGRPLPLAETLTGLAALDIPAAPEGLETLLDVTVLLNEPVPDLNEQVRNALDGKTVRLVATKRVVADLPIDGTMQATAEAGVTLTDIEPRAVFERLHVGEYANRPSEALLQAFDTIYADARSAVSGDA